MNDSLLSETFRKNRLMPAVTVTDTKTAVHIAEALLEGGLTVMEITFRTAVTAEAIAAIVTECPEMTVGAGTILKGEQVNLAQEAGARFGLAPGYNPTVVEEALARRFPFIPGVSTPSEIEVALERGYRLLKLFPADILGGPAYLKSLQGPYGHTGIRLIPMGGVGLSNLQSYSAFQMVAALGGSWLTPADLLHSGEYGKITRLVRESLAQLTA